MRDGGWGALSMVMNVQNIGFSVVPHAFQRLFYFIGLSVELLCKEHVDLCSDKLWRG
jgi:hypothetical protein